MFKEISETLKVEITKIDVPEGLFRIAFYRSIKKDSDSAAAHIEKQVIRHGDTLEMELYLTVEQACDLVSNLAEGIVSNH